MLILKDVFINLEGFIYFSLVVLVMFCTTLSIHLRIEKRQENDGWITIPKK